MKPYSLLLSLLLIPPVSAQQGHRQHDAHVHGHAQLNLVVSGQMLQVELESPSNNLLGFEHRARSEQDRKVLQQALAVLNEPAEWLQPDPAAACQLQDIEIQSALLKTDHDDEHEKHKKHAEHDDHDDEHGAEDAARARADQAYAQWRFAVLAAVEEVESGLAGLDAAVRAARAADRAIERIESGEFFESFFARDRLWANAERSDPITPEGLVAVIRHNDGRHPGG